MDQVQGRLTIEDLSTAYHDPSFLDKLEQLYCVSSYYGACLPSPDYSSSAEWTQAIVPNLAGRQAVDAATRSLDTSDADASLAVLVTMFKGDLLLDVEQTDLEHAVSILSNDVRNKNIVFPWIYTRELFDRFFQSFPPERDYLDPHEVERLIGEMDQGVYQFGKLVVGPFGVLPSMERRYQRPSRMIGLRLCSDPTCDRLHPCELLPFDCGPARVVKAMEETDEGQRRNTATWHRFLLKRLRPDKDLYDQTSRAQLCLLIATAFTKDELTLVLDELIALHPSLYRRGVDSSGDGTERVPARAREYTCRLSHGQLLQQILRSKDADLVRVIDRLVEQRQVLIPPTEIRRSRFTGQLSIHSVRAECSHLGLRFLPDIPSFGARRLVSLISNVHDMLDSWIFLNFVLRRSEGETPADRLVNYLSSIDPREALKATLFITEQHLEAACRALGFEDYSPPVDEAAEVRIISGMLWKMGFPLPAQPSVLSQIRSQLESLVLESRVQETYSLAQEDRVRSAAVNAFVTLEKVLTDALNFAGWALLSDHFLTTKFNYRTSDARDFVFSLLNGVRVGEGSPLEFNPDGQNSLFPLIEGFKALAELCEQVIADSLAHQRTEDTVPSEEQWTQLSPFPLKHHKLILDLRSARQSTVTDTLRDIASTLNRANVMGIRNRLSHSGRQFPRRSEIEDAIHAITAVVDVLETSGLYPVVYDRRSQSTDVFGRGKAIYGNYRGALVELIRPSYIPNCRMPNSGPTVIIVPCLTIGPAAEPVRFRPFEHSEYGDLWVGIPPRRADLVVSSVLTQTDDYVQTSSNDPEGGSTEEQSDW